MKSTVAILILLACTIGLGGAYSFFPKQLETSHPDFRVTAQRAAIFGRNSPYVHLHWKYSVHYEGENPVWLLGWGKGNVHIETPSHPIGMGCFGPSFSLVHPGDICSAVEQIDEYSMKRSLHRFTFGEYSEATTPEQPDYNKLERVEFEL